MRLLCLLLLLTSTICKGQFNPSEIEIIRDEWGVPHIYAPTDAQVSYGLAWAHAEDDFETIQEILLAAKQMMGRYQGPDGAPIDYVVGLLRCEDIVNEHLDEVDSAFIKIAKGYIAGLNAYAKSHKDEVLVKKAFPVTLTDIFKAYVLQLAVQDGADNLIRNLFDGNIDTVDFETKGSNAFAISRKKTTSDEVFLAVNSHQPLEGPAAWYEAHLVSDEGWNMLGGLFPGGSVIFHGTNEHLGWAHTVNYFDKRDVFQLEMHPEDENLYRVDDEWMELEKRKIKLKVKVFLGIKIGVKRDAYYSVYGPVVKNDKGFFAFHMAVFDEIRAIEQWYKMNKATNLSEFKNALSMTAIPSFNIVYADKYDSLFYVGNGKVPFRNPKYDWSSTIPGNTSETIPQGYHPFTDLPQITNPLSGYLFNTNNGAFNATAPADNLNLSDYDSTMGYRAFDNNRSYRFMELIDQHDQLSWSDFLDIKYDATLPDSLVYWIDLNPVFDLDPALADSASQVLEIIQSWNKNADVDAMGAAHLNILYKGLARISDKIDVNNISTEQYYKAVDYVRRYLIRYFGKIEVTLGEYQKLVRGNDEYPIGGLPDVIAAMHSDYMGEGKVRAKTGESYIMMVRYPKEGLPIIETVNVFGASNRPESPHYDDQISLFLNQKRKQMTLDIEEVRKNAKSIYHPE
ncbi:penicillin acylase family protein [Ekhidna sp.]|jgi:acyl-homoserine-lactone acylase|uniref:penicillin acylase family protein n=1 Tax=Ekhidna sp. TaxID=2608089 RepID=UPI0032ED3552